MGSRSGAEQFAQTHEAKVKSLQTSIDAMTNKHGARSDWAKALGGTKARLTPIWNAELQPLWLSEKPILFIANIDDVSINENGTYRVTATHNSLTSTGKFYGNKLRLRVDCPAEIGQALVQLSSRRKIPSIFADIALIGKISAIDTSTEPDESNEQAMILTGTGACLDAMYLTEIVHL